MLDVATSPPSAGFRGLPETPARRCYKTIREMVGYDEFQRTRFFPVLDGLRAVSILLVLTIHSHVTALRPLHGNVGVTLFFVISGFIITTLLLREERIYGHAREYTFSEVEALLTHAGLRVVSRQSRHFHLGDGRVSKAGRVGKVALDRLARGRRTLGPAIIVVAQRD